MTELARTAVLARWWRTRVIGDVHHEAVLEKISSQSGWDGAYAFAIVISAGISILGLLLPSSAVLIGAMLISPLMMPIIGLGFGIATFDLAEMRRAAAALLLGALIAVTLSAAFVAVSPIQTVTSEIAIRTRPNLFDLLVALLSALAGGYALIRERSTTVVGVAIAIALMPPLAVVGFGIATQNWTVLGGSLLLFLTNLVTIALTAAVVARLYGFGAHLSPAQTRLQGFLIVAGLAALAVPLALALHQIAFEALAQRQVRDAVLAPFGEGARVSQLDIDFDREPIRVRAAVLTPRIVGDADARILAGTQTALRRPLDLHVDQIRIGLESTDAAQVAAAQPNSGPVVDAAGETPADQLALVAGVDRGQVTLDRVARRARVVAAILPGAGLSAYHVLEQRIAGSAPGWTIELVPPAVAPGEVAFEGDAPTDGGRATLADAVWAARRTGLALLVDGAEAPARATLALLDQAKVTASRGNAPSLGAVARLSWQVPPAPTPVPR